MAEALDLYRAAQKAGIKHGVVQDKLWLPGLLKLKMLVDTGFFGRILSVRGEFGYWVFEGDWQPAQRPSWNYRKEDGGGIILDMLCHWRYVLDNLFGDGEGGILPGRDAYPRALGRERAASTRRLPTMPPTRPCNWKAAPLPTSTAPGACACGATICSRCRWTARTARRWPGCGAASPSRASTRPSRSGTPTSRRRSTSSQGWQEVPDNIAWDNAFKAQWELFLSHVAGEGDFRWNLLEGAKGVQLAELGVQELERAALAGRAEAGSVKEEGLT